jgi:hypothetical protein
MRSEIAALKEKLEAERAERIRKEGEHELTVGRLRQEIQEKDGITAALRKELRASKSENRDHTDEIGMLREELYKTRQQASDPVLKRETIENLASLNHILEEKEREKQIWQRKCGEAVESLEILRSANQQMSTALKEKDAHLEQVQNAQSDLTTHQSHLYSRLAIERESMERKSVVYKEVVEILLTLLKWKTIDLKLNENLNHCSDPVKASETRANIRQLRAEEEEMREHLESKMHQLQGGEGFDEEEE